MFKYIRNISAKNQTIIPFDFLFCVFLNNMLSGAQRPALAG